MVKDTALGWIGSRQSRHRHTERIRRRYRRSKFRGKCVGRLVEVANDLHSAVEDGKSWVSIDGGVDIPLWRALEAFRALLPDTISANLDGSGKIRFQIV